MARNAEKNEQLKQVSQEKIRLAALKQFAENGLFATRIQDIAAEAQISQGLLYRHYASKNEIYVALISEALQKMNSAALALLSQPISGKSKILNMIDAMYHTIETSETYRQTCRLISEVTNSEAIPEAAKLAVVEQRELPYKLLSQIIEQGQLEGDVVEGDAYELAILFWSTLNGLTTYRQTRDGSCHLPHKALIARMLLKNI